MQTTGISARTMGTHENEYTRDAFPLMVVRTVAGKLDVRRRLFGDGKRLPHDVHDHEHGGAHTHRAGAGAGDAPHRPYRGYAPHAFGPLPERQRREEAP